MKAELRQFDSRSVAFAVWGEEPDSHPLRVSGAEPVSLLFGTDAGDSP